MEKGNLAHEEPSSLGWGASFFVHTAEDVSAAAVTPPSPSARPSVVFSSKGDTGSPLQKLQSQVFRVLKGLSPPPEEKNRNYNPEVLTSQKRQWASFQLQALHQRILKEPSRLFESMVVVGLHPGCDIQALKRQYFGRRPEGSGRLRSALSGQHQFRVEPNLEPQVLFVYPPDKQLPMRSKDLLSFCFPGGVEVHAIERTPSMSELNEILLGQEHLKQNDQSFVFRLQGADDSILYGCCVLVDELVQQPSRLISLTGDGEAFPTPLSRHILTTRRCYCILSRLPFFELHFGVLNSIFTEERLERLTKSISDLDMESTYDDEVFIEDRVIDVSAEAGAHEMLNETTENVQLRSSVTENATDEHHFLKVDSLSLDQGDTDSVIPVRPEIEIEMDLSKKECVAAESVVDICDSHVDYNVSNKQPSQKHIPNAILPLLRYQQYDSSDSSSSFQGSPSEDRNFRSDVDSADTEETSFSGQEDNEQNDILEWAKTNNHGSLQIICEYNRLCVPARGSTIKFHPLEHLHPLEFHRPDETVLHMAANSISQEGIEEKTNMALPIFLLLALIAPSSTFSTPIQQDPTLVVEHVHRKINESRRNMGFFSCGTGNPIDDCWRCDKNWEKNRQRLADCAIGFGKHAIGGRDGKIYVVTDSKNDDPVNPKPGTLRYGVIQNEPLWIIFAHDMTIKLKEELMMNSFKTIDGRGADVHIAGGPCITIQYVSNIIIHGVNIHDCKQGGNTDVRDSPDHYGFRTISDGDGVSIFGGSHVWVDHCSLANCHDGLIDAIHGSTAITISNNYMTHHDKVMLLGHSDTLTSDKNMQVTIAFNHFGEGLVQRMPRCRHGYFHVVNNDYTHWEMYAIGGSASPTINSQGNRFLAPNTEDNKEVTKREEAGEDEWKSWNWRSEGDLMLNGAFFTPSGGGASKSYARASSLSARPSSIVASITANAGVLGCKRGSRC